MINFNNTHNLARTGLKAFMQAAKPPLLLLVMVYVLYFGFIILMASLPRTDTVILINTILNKLTNITLVIALFWFMVRLTHNFTNELYQWAIERHNSIGMSVFPLINNSLKVIATLLLINILLPYLAIPALYLPLAEKAATLLLITAIAWIIVQIINASEQYFLHRHGVQISENLQTRKIYTQITVLKKIAISLVITLAVAAALMTFDRVRELGTTLLASAGLIAAIGAFAAQKTLSSTFSGLQIALTQPIKINDAVVVENEFGIVEEITLSYVVLKLWDLRRLIVPINYFIEKPFQNWTRNSSNLIGTVMLYVDYSLPLDDIRAKFQEILANSALWDKKTAALQVTDTRERTMEVRLLASAIDAGKTFDLRCEIREKMITYIREHYPDCLPKMRLDSDSLIKQTE